jgi:hypothetical protein
MPQIFLPIDAISGGDAAFSARCDAVAAAVQRITRGWSITATKAAIDSSAPIDLGCIRRNDAQGKRGGTDPQYLMGE